MRIPNSCIQTGARRARRLLRPSLCALFVLVACTKPDRDFSDFSGGSGGEPGQAGDSGEAGARIGEGGEGGSPDSSGSTGDAGDNGTGSTGRTAGGSGGMPGGGGDAGAGGETECSTTDPNCECVGGDVVAIDGDGDGHGTIDCAPAPGDDCDDDDYTFQHNECGGCEVNIGGTVGAGCDECGVLACDGTDAVECVVPEPVPRQCGNPTTPEECIDGFWVAQAACAGSTLACYEGNCYQCVPGTYRCEPFSADEIIYRCDATGSWESFGSCFASFGETCDAQTGTCTTMLHPRDASFEVAPALGIDVNAVRDGRPTDEVLELAVGTRFG
jgi:hypothetical protein